MVMLRRPTLERHQLAELTPLEMKKYKTRTMLNEILSAKDVIRKTTSPWLALTKASEVHKRVLLFPEETETSEVSSEEEPSEELFKARTPPPAEPEKEMPRRGTTFITKTDIVEPEAKPTSEDEFSVTDDQEDENEEENADPFRLLNEGKKIEPSVLVDGGFIDIARLGGGASFGELALIDGKPRMCTVKAISRVHML